MTKVLIFGSTGMLGHKLYQVLDPKFDVFGAIRSTHSDVEKYGFFSRSNIIPGLDALNIDEVERVIADVGPDVVINCIGIVKSLVESVGMISTISLNSLLPHQFYQVCHAKRIRLVHISTDCVFSGNKGNYCETDPSDAEDIYGKTKYLGEVDGDGALTIRTSIIGPELTSGNGLLEWLLSNRGGEILGYSKAIFSGFPTLHFSRIIADIIENHRDLSGIYHISSEPISKFDLLTLINNAMELNIRIKDYPDYKIDRSLDSTAYWKKTGFRPTPWEKMVEELTVDMKSHLDWR